MQAEALQQTRKEVRELEVELEGQQKGMDQLAAERDACKAGAHEASDRSKVTCVAIAFYMHPIIRMYTFLYIWVKICMLVSG